MLGIARQMTLRQRLVALVAVAFAPAILALAYFILAFHQEREQEVRDQALQNSQIVALEMQRIVSGAEAVLETLAFAPPVRSFSPNCPDYLAEIITKLTQFSGFAVADAQGHVRCAAGAITGDDVAGEPWFAAALAQRDAVVGEYTNARPDVSPYLPVAMRAGDEGHEMVLVTGIDLAWLGAAVRERELPPSSVLAIADRTGTILAREPMPESYVGTPTSEHLLPLLYATRPGTAEVVGSDGEQRIVGFQPPAATGTGLYVGVGLSTAVAFAPVYASTWRILALTGAGAAAACVVVWTIGDRLFRQPIRRILATIASWRTGDESARTGIAADASELSALAASIDEYMDGLVAARGASAAAEKRRALLLREMNHRIKNILAAVQAVAYQTFKGRAPPECMRAFSSRLHAMAAVHDLLVSEDWESADLKETILAAIEPFSADQQRFSLEGPPVQITPKAALALSMALHELCTNAGKYGALTTPGGQVAISWGLAPSERFHLSWTERGGPPVTAPDHRGFGSQLIQSTLGSELGATAELSFAEAGVELLLDADAARVVADPRIPATEPDVTVPE